MFIPSFHHIHCSENHCSKKREQKAKVFCMYVCGAVVILHFAQLDPLNPKPITEDLPSTLPQPPPHWRLRQYIQAASCLPLALSLVISSGASLPIGCFKVLSQSSQLPSWALRGKPMPSSQCSMPVCSFTFTFNPV